MAAAGMDRNRVFEFMSEEVAAAAAKQQAPVLRGGVAFDLFDDGGSLQGSGAAGDACAKSAQTGEVSAFAPLSPRAARQRAEALSTAVQEWRLQQQQQSQESAEQGVEIRQGPIAVCVRVRPLNEAERAAEGTADDRGRPLYSCLSVVGSKGTVAMHSEEPALGAAPTGRLATATMSFHSAFGEDADGLAVYEAVGRSLADAARSDSTAHFIAYGPTGTGKTHTASALAEKLAEDLTLTSEGGGLTITLFENLGERCFDLLSEQLSELQVLEDDSGRVRVLGLTAIRVKTVDEALSVLRRGFAARRAEVTEVNARSSRSHAVCQLSLVAQGEGDVRSCVRVVDLAGSERSRDTLLHSAERMQEAKQVNWSLACLRECVQCSLRAARGAKAHIPYRRSKLTMLLRECFEPGARCVWMVHTAPMSMHLSASKSTLASATELLSLPGAGGPTRQAAPLPQTWPRSRFAKWLREAEGGRFAHLCEALQWADGRAILQEWLPDLVARCSISGVSEQEVVAVREALGAVNAEALRRAKKMGVGSGCAQACSSRSGIKT
eukprot:gnl/TRDRNA2_/TRDRNA2_39539_c0_seq2.p1 gnl/TRDRNA2_/TRDRNA2_39539_c0~~gnl/TRDRNA2_/TRDRNA2_39539_c0_seq2.p1  ORF type:complete len:576 (-),score=71.94 gnl/TRDRNA2_/TRDRNA2_39539_c0_seq2:290-1945(-)